ncbi:hypothetical protein TcWFU_002014 [Taenia crassiceps]|uniref:Uncharacterized protein n=1 Tax=Taenia crassiceps TaxID=6207 RepID=A0ABR4QCG2_9CEST
MLLPYVKKLETYMKSGTRHPVYPWSVASRIRQFPYTWYYQNNKFVRFLGGFYCLALLQLLISLHLTGWEQSAPDLSLALKPNDYWILC